MGNWVQVRRVVIIVDTTIEPLIVQHIMKSGAQGYNCVYCSGKGRHEVLEDPFTGRSLVRIEVLAREEIAEAILDFVHEPQFGPYSITAYMDTVEVDPRDEQYF